MQKNATHPFGSSTSTTRIAPPAGRHVATNVLYRFAVGFPYRVERPGRPPAPLPGPLGQVDPAAPRRSAAGPAARAPAAGHGPQGRVLPEPADHRHPEATHRLEERGLGVRPVGHHPQRLAQEPEPRTSPTASARRPAPAWSGTPAGASGRCRPGSSRGRTAGPAAAGRSTPHAGWAASSPRTTHTCPYTNGLAGRPGGRVVVDPGPLDVPPVPLGRGVVEGERQPARRRPPAA